MPLLNPGPLELALDLVDEDPNQPRTNGNPGFALRSLKELAETIRVRGVKTPISVREHPQIPGRFIINHGARRVRASRLAGRTTVPAFVDNDYNEADQVIENLQRNELTAREIADFIGRELAKGVRKSEIARSIGKSPAFVSQHVTLLDLPDPVSRIFQSGRTRDVTVINELVTLHRRNPRVVADWLDDESQELTRSSVKLLREFLEEKRSREEAAFDPGVSDGFIGSPEVAMELDSGFFQEEKEDARRARARTASRARLRKPVVRVLHAGRPARLLLARAPSMPGRGWIRYEDDGEECECDLARVQLVALFEGV